MRTSHSLERSPAARPVGGHAAVQPLPPLSSEGHVLVAVAYYPPAPSGMSVTMHNLLSRFHPASYSIVTVGGLTLKAIDADEQARVYRAVPSLRRFSARLDRWWQNRQLPAAVSNLTRLIEQTRARALVGVYPTFHFLKLARDAALTARLPWVAYLHDTVVEALSNTSLAANAVTLQSQVFAEAESIMVMSRGMAQLYKRKYGLACQPLEHTYPEPIPGQPPAQSARRQAFWAGATYGINDRAVVRVSEALRRLDCDFLLTTTAGPRSLQRQGLAGSHLRTTFFPRRAEYLAALRQQGVLILALNWPDEAALHEDELATIFPTKTPEYLASGRPILVHCPEHYFLAEFFGRHGCGLVVSERSVSALMDGLARLLGHAPEVCAMQRAGLAAARQFSAASIAARFQAAVETAVGS